MSYGGVAAFQFFQDRFTADGAVTLDVQNFSIVKVDFLERLGKSEETKLVCQSSGACLDGNSLLKSVDRADHFFGRAQFNVEAKKQTTASFGPL